MVDDVKAEAMHMDIKQMVHDLRYAQGMMSATAENAKELQASLLSYIKTTRMEEFVTIVKTLTDEEIDVMTKEELNKKFPNHNLIAWGDVDIKEIPGSYDYPMEEYKTILKTFRDNLQTYDAMLKSLREAEDMVKRMTAIVRNTRISHAKNVASSDSPDAPKAQQFLQDLETIENCTDFFQYAKDHKDSVNNADKVYRHTRSQNKMKQLGLTCTNEDQECMVRYFNDDEMLSRFTAFMDAYVIYGDETTKRNATIKKQTIDRLHIFFRRYDPSVPENIPSDQTIHEKIHELFIPNQEEVKLNEPEGNI